MQKVRIKGTEINLTIQDEVYPFIENGVLYIRMVTLNYEGKPVEFLSIMPQDILYRSEPFTQEKMDEITAASDKAIEAFASHMATMEEEEEEKKEIDDIIDSHGGMHYG